MTNSSVRVLLTAGLVFGAADAASAQQVTVQQPVVQVFSVDTVVSVPDRGSAYLGGVSSAAEGRGIYGPFPLGSSTGLRRADTGVSAGVFIHDFEAMDEYLLSRPGERDDNWVNPNRQAAAAFDSLRKDRSGRTARRSAHSRTSQQTPSPIVGSAAESEIQSAQADSPSELAPFYLSRARSAELRGLPDVALLCYRLAARHGSSFAEEKLREMGDQ